MSRVRVAVARALALAVAYAAGAPALAADPTEIQVAILLHPVARGDILAAADFDRQPRAAATAHGALGPDEANGREAVRALPAGTNKATGTDTYDPDTLSIANQEIDLPATETASAGAGTGVLGQDSEIDTAAKAKAMVDTLDTLGSSLNTKLSDLGSGSRKIDAQMTFTSKLSDAIESGVGKLVDADLAKESAKLQALQVKQQLGVQALSIANQAPQTITSLFR